MTDHLRGLLLTTLGVVVLSPDGLLVRLIETDRWTLLFWRGLFMAAGLLAFLALRNGGKTLALGRMVGRPGLLAAALFTGSTIFFVNSLQMTAVANTLVIISAAPLFAALLSGHVLGEAVERRTWIAAVAVFAGLAVIFSGGLGGGTLAGDACAVGSALCIAGYLVIVRRARAVDMVPALAIGGMLIALVVAPLAAPLAVTTRDLLLLAILGAGVLGISFALITIGPRYLPAPEVGLIMLLEAALGPLWVWLVIGEVPTVQTALGGTVILSAVALHAASGLRRSAGRR